MGCSYGFDILLSSIFLLDAWYKRGLSAAGHCARRDERPAGSKGASGDGKACADKRVRERFTQWAGNGARVGYGMADGSAHRGLWTGSGVDVGRLFQRPGALLTGLRF